MEIDLEVPPVDTNGSIDHGTKGPPEPTPPSTLDQLGTKITGTVGQIGNLVNLWKAPVPNATGDGSYLPPLPKHGLDAQIRRMAKDVSQLTQKEVDTLVTAERQNVLHEDQLDRDYQMEDLIQVCYGTPGFPRSGR